MFAELASAVDGLTVPVDASAVAALVAIRDRLDAKLSGAISALDAAELWQQHDPAATSMTDWLTRQGASRRTAARSATHARRLARLPVVQSAWERGDLSSGQVETILSMLRDRHVGLLAQHEADLVPLLAPLTVTETSEAMAAWRRHAESAVDDRSDEIDDDIVPSTLFASPVGERTVVNGELDGRIGCVLRTALRVAESPDPDGVRRTPAERRADALGAICEFYLDNHAAPSTSHRNRPHVNVIVEQDDLNRRRGARTADGQLIDHPTLTAWLCDASLRLLQHRNGVTLDYGTAVRSAPAPLFNALVLRDQHCRFPGCDRPPHHCHAHHSHEARHRGDTSIHNLVLLCSYHHHLLHRAGWRWELDRDGTFHVIDAAGVRRTTRPPGRAGTLSEPLFADDVGPPALVG